MTPQVELIYDLDCPNVIETRKLLLRAFLAANLQPSWREFDRQAVDSPPYAKAYSSPTILVNGKDVAGAGAGNSSDANCCRLYTYQQKISGVPLLSQIVQALKQSARSDTTKKFGWHRFMAAIPSLAVLLPILPCPACWPAYAGILSALGLSFLWQATCLLPITSACLLLALFALYYKARSRRGYMPFILGIIAVGIILIGKFLITSNMVVYGGLGLFFLASIWNACPRK